MVKISKRSETKIFWPEKSTKWLALPFFWTKNFLSLIFLKFLPRTHIGYVYCGAKYWLNQTKESMDTLKLYVDITSGSPLLRVVKRSERQVLTSFGVNTSLTLYTKQESKWRTIAVERKRESRRVLKWREMSVKLGWWRIMPESFEPQFLVPHCFAVRVEWKH